VSHSTSSATLIRDVVARADRRARARGAVRALARLAPILAAVVLGLAAIARLLGWPPALPLAAMAVAMVCLIAFYLVARRTRPATDAIAASVDANASLSGELRSAHWFATHPGSDPWTDFHLARAAEHVDRVDWPALYPPVRAGRAWTVAAVCALGAIALSVSIPARPDARPGTVMVDGVAIEADQLPLELRKKLEALMAAMQDGQASAAEASATLEQLKDLMANVDPELQKRLEEMLKAHPLGDETPKGKTLDADELAERMGKDGSNAGLPEDVRWALEDLAARLANSAADQRQTNENNPSASGETGEKGLGSDQAQTEMGNAQASMQMVKEAAADPGDSKMMMGGGAMGGDSRPGAGGNDGAQAGAADALLIAKALRKELVEASADMQGENVTKEDIRRKTEQGKSAMGFTRVAPGSVERSRADAPPPVPEARRELLQRYFIRR
jgi:hypothetical protein